MPIDLRLGTSNNLIVSRDFSITDFSITPQIGQYGFKLDFENWEPSSDYLQEYNTTKDGFTIRARGMVIGSNNPDYSPISGSRSFALNGRSSFSNYVQISGLNGVGTVSIKVAPRRDGTGDQDATLLVSDGTTDRRFPILPYADVQTLSIEFNNPSAQEISISPVRPTSPQRASRIRIDDIEF